MIVSSLKNKYKSIVKMYGSIVLRPLVGAARAGRGGR